MSRMGGVRAVVALAAAAMAVTTIAGPARADEYPTWQDVQAAKANAAAAQAEVTNLTSLLTQLQDEAATSQQKALDAGIAASKAQAQLDAATATAQRLSSQADAARDTAAKDRRTAGAFAVQLQRAGGTVGVTVSILVSSDASRLLDSLTNAAQLGAHAIELQRSAEYAMKSATSLERQADAAENVRAERATAAKRASADAVAAAATAATAAAAAQQQLATMQQQLAYLTGQSQQTYSRYLLGLAVAAQAAQQASSGSGNWGIDTSGVVNDPAGAKSYAASQLPSYGWGSDQYSCLISLWTRESGWRTNALNSSSGAYGIPQSLPGSKMAVAGADWITNFQTQIDWGLAYISRAYSSPCGAWAHETSHGWY